MVCRGALCEKGEGRVPPGRGWWEGEGTPYVSWIVGWCMAKWMPGKLFGGRTRGLGAAGKGATWFAVGPSVKREKGGCRRDGDGGRVMGERYVSWLAGWCMAMWIPGRLFGEKGIGQGGWRGGTREIAGRDGRWYRLGESL